MAAPMHKVPTDLQRRAASAVRQFPKGCADDKGVSKPDLAPLSPVESNSADDAASSTPMTAPISFNMPKDPSPEGVSENGADSETKKNLDVQLPANSRTPPRAWAVRVFPPACGRTAAAASVASGNKTGDVEGIMDLIKEFSEHCAKGVRDNADPSDKKTRIAVDVPKRNLTHLSPVKSNAAHNAASTAVRTPTSFNMPKDPSHEEESENGANFETKKKTDVQFLAKSRTPPRGAVRYFRSACGAAAGDPEGIKDETKEFRGNARKHSTKSVRDNAELSDNRAKIVVQALMAAETCPWRRVKGKIGVAACSAPPKCR